MSKGMLGGISLSDFQGPRNDFEQKLSGEDGKIWLDAFKCFLRKENPWDNKSVLFESLSLITIPATTEKFIIAKKFKVDKSKDTEVKIQGITGDNFQKWFWNKEEMPIAETILCSVVLRREAGSDEIIARLGGKTVAETNLTTIYQLMKKDTKIWGDGGPNIFYVPDNNNVLRWVWVHQFDGSWVINSDEIGKSGWYDGTKVYFPAIQIINLL